VNIFDKVCEFVGKDINRLLKDSIFVSQTLCDLVALILNVGSNLGKDERCVDQVIPIREDET